MDKLYWVCLIVGGLYSVISLVFSGLFDGLDFDFDFDADFDFDFALPIKPFTIMVFATVFGGVGLIALNFMPSLFTLIPAVVLGVALAALLYRLVYVKLRRYETETPTEADTLMVRAQVVEAIPAGGYGKISFVIDGNTISGAAREKRNTGGVPKGHEVFILDHADNVYYVAEDLQFYLTE